MKDNQSTSCIHGLKFIPFMKNGVLYSVIKRTSYEVIFGCSPRVVLSTTAIQREVFDSVKDEPQFENTLTAVNTFLYFLPPPS